MNFVYKIALSFSLLFLVQPLSAVETTTTQTTSATTVKYEIVAPTTAYANESIDVTVRAVDANGNVVPGYRGTILFNSEDLKAILPYQSLGYQFRAEDRGEKVFSKGVTFKNTGSFKLLVNDLNDDIEGEIRIKVEARDVPVTGGSTETIAIITPEPNSSQPWDSLIIAGKTKKNSKVGIFLNTVEVGSVLSDSEWSFTKEVTDLTEKTYILQAKLYDAANATIASSPEIKFDLANDLPTFLGLSVTQWTTVDAGELIEFLLEGDAGLSEVLVTLDGSVTTLKEGAAGKYSATTRAPSAPWKYDLDVSLKNSLSQVTSKLKVLSLEVVASLVEAPVGPKFQNVKVETLGGSGRVDFTFALDTPPTNLGSFKILYGTSATMMNKEVKTLAADKIKKPDGNYGWYIPNLTNEKWYFKIVPLDTTDTVIASVESDMLEANISTIACTIGNVAGLSVIPEGNKSILKWESLTGAISYNVYKKNADGTMLLVENVKTPMYTIYLAPGAVTYNDFWVRALCGDGKTESPDVALATKVQTGPGLIIFLVLFSGLVALFITKREYFLIGR
jgi:hypothetical protein